MIRGKLRALLVAPHKRALSAEARFFDSYGRGGNREPRDLVIPIDYFARPRVKTIVRDWLIGETPIDVDALCAEWRATAPSATEREERLFFKNLADFVSLVVAGAPAGAPPTRRASWWVPRSPQPWQVGRRRG